MTGSDDTDRANTQQGQAKGWECPRCGIVHHPDTRFCFCPKRVKLVSHPKPTPWRMPGEFTPVREGKKISSGIAAAHKKLPDSLEAWMDENNREIAGRPED